MRAYDDDAFYWTHFLRGQACLRLHRGPDALANSRQSWIIRDTLSVLYPLAQRGFAEVAKLTGDAAQAAPLRYRDSAVPWPAAKKPAAGPITRLLGQKS